SPRRALVPGSNQATNERHSDRHGLRSFFRKQESGRTPKRPPARNTPPVSRLLHHGDALHHLPLRGLDAEEIDAGGDMAVPGIRAVPHQGLRPDPTNLIRKLVHQTTLQVVDVDLDAARL